ncbi:hypothetical protein BS50DRAFT_100151 [Corynespora cassiicola Philippines]|uniref:Transmembrane protein n=1 Tax=Corynespora cassiicola Philippines TaxID=1448308 RepID=A0A2T2MZF2_CORCC|nr:hypothetical protein BS50DRAFT_100151 [Corynespora cassiicola Philippines]
MSFLSAALFALLFDSASLYLCLRHFGKLPGRVQYWVWIVLFASALSPAAVLTLLEFVLEDADLRLWAYWCFPFGGMVVQTLLNFRSIKVFLDALKLPLLRSWILPSIWILICFFVSLARAFLVCPSFVPPHATAITSSIATTIFYVFSVSFQLYLLLKVLSQEGPRWSIRLLVKITWHLATVLCGLAATWGLLLRFLLPGGASILQTDSTVMSSVLMAHSLALHIREPNARKVVDNRTFERKPEERLNISSDSDKDPECRTETGISSESLSAVMPGCDSSGGDVRDGVLPNDRTVVSRLNISTPHPGYDNHTRPDCSPDPSD